MSAKYIGEGGRGSEAQIDIELRTKFPGMGGTIYTGQAIPVASRKSFNPSHQVGHREFLKHAVFKKIEDYFFRKDLYRYAHITRPLGSKPKSYIYEWAFGRDGFSWYYSTSESEVTVKLDDWDKFTNAFQGAGIDMQADCTDAYDGRQSQNIVHQLLALGPLQPELNCLWKRIDFGARSVRIDFESLRSFIIHKEKELRESLRHGRYELLKLACQFLIKGEGELGAKKMRQLEALVVDYRLSTLRHLDTKGVEAEESSHIQLERE